MPVWKNLVLHFQVYLCKSHYILYSMWWTSVSPTVTNMYRKSAGTPWNRNRLSQWCWIVCTFWTLVRRRGTISLTPTSRPVLWSALWRRLGCEMPKVVDVCLIVGSHGRRSWQLSKSCISLQLFERTNGRQKRSVESSIQMCPQAFCGGLYTCSNGSFTE